MCYVYYYWGGSFVSLAFFTVPYLAFMTKNSDRINNNPYSFLTAKAAIYAHRKSLYALSVIEVTRDMTLLSNPFS